eukprot:1159040-Pelagomonas_calceolata.AAC.4
MFFTVPTQALIRAFPSIPPRGQGVRGLQRKNSKLRHPHDMVSATTHTCKQQLQLQPATQAECSGAATSSPGAVEL